MACQGHTVSWLVFRFRIIELQISRLGSRNFEFRKWKFRVCKLEIWVFELTISSFETQNLDFANSEFLVSKLKISPFEIYPARQRFLALSSRWETRGTSARNRTILWSRRRPRPGTNKLKKTQFFTSLKRVLNLRMADVSQNAVRLRDLCRYPLVCCEPMLPLRKIKWRRSGLLLNLRYKSNSIWKHSVYGLLWES